MESNQDPMIIATEDGTVDLGRLVQAAQGIRRNALQDAEHDRPFGMDRRGVALVTMGMKIAVLHLLGDDAAQVFQDAIDTP